MRLPYHILDVFTNQRFGGNPLAVVLDADGLDAARMQTIAREFNLSETVFVSEAAEPGAYGARAHLHARRSRCRSPDTRPSAQPPCLPSSSQRSQRAMAMR